MWFGVYTEHKNIDPDEILFHNIIYDIKFTVNEGKRYNVYLTVEYYKKKNLLLLYVTNGRYDFVFYPDDYTLVLWEYTNRTCWIIVYRKLSAPRVWLIDSSSFVVEVGV